MTFATPRARRFDFDKSSSVLREPRRARERERERRDLYFISAGRYRRNKLPDRARRRLYRVYTREAIYIDSRRDFGRPRQRRCSLCLSFSAAHPGGGGGKVRRYSRVREKGEEKRRGGRGELQFSRASRWGNARPRVSLNMKLALRPTERNVPAWVRPRYRRWYAKFAFLLYVKYGPIYGVSIYTPLPLLSDQELWRWI